VHQGQGGLAVDGAGNSSTRMPVLPRPSAGRRNGHEMGASAPPRTIPSRSRSRQWTRRPWLRSGVRQGQNSSLTLSGRALRMRTPGLNRTTEALMAQPNYSTAPVFEDDEKLESIEDIRAKKSFREACKSLIRLYKTQGVEVVKEIYQTGNSRYPKDQSGFDSSGICRGMTLKWIQLAKNGRDAIFQTWIDDDWTEFGRAQGKINLDTEKAIQPTRQAVKQLDEDENFIWNYENKQGQFEPKKEQGFFGPLLNTVEDMWNQVVYANKLDKRDELYKQVKGGAENDRKATKLVYEEFVYVRTQNNLPRGLVEEKCAEEPIAKVTADLGYYIGDPAYYFLELNGDAKHGVALCTIVGGDAKPRFMDPNICEFRFPNLDVMYRFLSVYFDLYEKKQSPNTKCWLLKFN
jgi:hypothetical protein